MKMKQQLEGVVEALIDDLKENIQTEIAATVSADIVKHIVESELNDLVEKLVARKLREMIELGNLPQRSISHQCIDYTNFSLTGDHVKGGIIEGFSSTGIEDRASSVQLTIMDKAAVFEKPVFAPEVNVKGKLTVDGDLIIKGEIPTDSKTFTNLVEFSAVAVKEKLDETLFSGYSNLIHKELLESGIDLDIIKQGGKEVIKGNQLGYHIIDTNIQRLGLVRDLQSVGETLLSSSFYVTQRRAGVNTIDPSATFVVWDEEVELIMTKKQYEEGFIGTGRPQKLVVGSNKKENITCNPDGSTRIDHLRVGRTQIGSSAAVPNFSSESGHILLNENPSLGGPMGWVCLGGSQWANFGVID